MSNLRPGQYESLSRAEWWVLAEAGVQLGLARLAVLTLPFRWAMRACGTHMAESPPTLDAAGTEAAARVTWAIDTMRLFTPWESNCLAQAIAGARMLRRRGVATTTYLGVTANALEDLGAHAWLRAGPEVILGDHQLETYATVSSFATTVNKRQT